MDDPGLSAPGYGPEDPCDNIKVQSSYNWMDGKQQFFKKSIKDLGQHIQKCACHRNCYFTGHLVVTPGE